MEKTSCFRNFPIWIVLLSNLVTVSIYVIGAYFLAKFGILLAILYLLYCVGLEISILRGSCIHCYYYDRICGLGKGKLCSLFFKKGNPQKFIEKEFTWLHMVPVFMVSILPIIGGIMLLIIEFAWILIALLVILFILSFGGNAILRRSFVCKYCRQRELGCPAEKLFGISTK